MTTHHAQHRRRAAIVLAAASTLVLTGCASGSLPPAERPEVVWADGEPPGPLDDDPWVQAARASDLELRIAVVTRDFTGTALWDTNSSGEVFALLRSVEESARHGEWSFPPGPTPMIPIHVQVTASGRTAVIYTCEAADWSISADEPEVVTPLRGRFMVRTVVLEDGHRKGGMVESSNLDEVTYVLGEDVIAPFLDDREDSDCNLDDAKIGLFDPQPDVTVEYAPEDIKTTTSQ